MTSWPLLASWRSLPASANLKNHCRWGEGWNSPSFSLIKLLQPREVSKSSKRPQHNYLFPPSSPPTLHQGGYHSLTTPDPNVHGGATDYNLVGTSALYLKTKQLIVAGHESISQYPRGSPLGDPTVGSGSSCWVSRSAFNPSYHIIGTTYEISQQL